jgi:hypothetical protein
MRLLECHAIGTIVSLSLVVGCSSPGGPEKASTVSSALTFAGDVLTQRVDNGRTGATTFAGLNATSFGSTGGWGLLATLPVAGPVWSQPLFAQQVPIGSDNNKLHDLILIATAQNHVYAFDANTLNSTPLWQVWLGPGDSNSGNLFTPGCLNTDGTLCNGGKGLGILSTPVVDRQNGWLDLTYRTTVGTVSSLHIVALSLGNGASVFDHTITNAPMVPDTSVAGHPGLKCSGMEICGALDGVYQRASLLLSNNILYVGFTMQNEQYWTWAANQRLIARGQINAYNASTLGFLGSFVTVDGSPTQMGGGIWQASVGPAADANGDVYFATGNAMSFVANPPAPTSANGWLDPEELGTTSNPWPSDYAPIPGSYGNSVVHLHPEQMAAGFVLSPVTSFTPNRSYWHNVEDIDLGASGPMLVPGTNQLVHAGKEGILYVLDRDSMGDVTDAPLTQQDYRNWATEFPAPPSTPSTCPTADFKNMNTPRFLPSAAPGEVGPIQILDLAENFDVSRPIANCWGDFPHIHGSPSFATFVDGSSYLYVWPEKDFLKAFKATSLSPLALATIPATSDSTAPLPGGMPGGGLAVSTDPTAGGGVVFASSPMDVEEDAVWMHGTLRAFNAIPNQAGRLTQLWSNFGAQTYFYAKFVPPTIAKNHVIQATFSDEVLVYGPRAGAAPMYAPPSTAVGMASEGAAQEQTEAAFVANDGAVHVLWKGNGDGWDAAHNGQISAPNVAAPGTPVTLVASGDGLYAVFVDLLSNVHWLSRAFPSAWIDQGEIATTSHPGGPARLGAIGEGSALAIFVVEQDTAMHVLIGNGTAPFSDTAISATGDFPLVTNVATTTNGPSELDAFAADSGSNLERFVSEPVLDGSDWTPWAQSVITQSQTFPPGVPLAAASSPTLGAYGVDFNGTVTGFALPAPGAGTYTGYTEGGFNLGYFTGPGYAPVGSSVAVSLAASATNSVQATLLLTTFLYVVGHPGALDAFPLPAPLQLPAPAHGPAPTQWTAEMVAHTRSFGIGAAGGPVAAFGDDVIVGGSNGLFAVPYLAGQTDAEGFRQLAVGDDAWSIPLLLPMNPPPQPAQLVPELETIPSSGEYLPLQTWVSADFNVDGKADVANIWSTSQWGPIGIDVYDNQGGGSFQLQAQWGKVGSTGEYASTEKWVVGDYNNDGRPDLANVWAMADGDSLGIDVYLNQNDGFNFQPQWGKVGSTGEFMASQKWVSGDFNDDGWADLANIWSPTALGPIGIDVYLNTKKGGFVFQPQWGALQTQGQFSATQSFFAGDFDQDGWTDIADVWDESVAGVPQIGIDVHLNTKTSGFLLSAQWGAIGDIGVWDATQKWVVGDFNADGFPDLAKAFSDDNSGFVSIDVHLNSGARTFGITRMTTLVGPYNGGANVFNASVPCKGFDVNQTWFAGAFHGDGLDFAYVYPNDGVAGIGEFYH